MKFLAVLLLMLSAPLAQAADRLLVTDAWARATPPGATVAAVYLTLDNAAGESDRLLSVASPRAHSAEVHATVRDGEVVRMRKVEPLHVAARERLTLAPGGTHVMLFGITTPLVQGERVPVVLRFELAGEVRVDAEVLAGGATGPAAGHKHH
jgi:hypothetical protein